MRFFYVPLEPYEERYTKQLSAPKTGWMERQLIKHNIDYQRIEGKALHKESTFEIKSGSVLDAHVRSYWALSQVMELIKMLSDGKITGADIIFFDDFWHPGISALKYCFDLSPQAPPKMYAFLYAQSVDQNDFTYPMRWWMRDFEKGIGNILDGIFVTSTCLKDMLIYAGIATEKKIDVCGLFYDSEEVKERIPKKEVMRNRQVVFTSRWDKEKRPDLFLKIARYVIAKDPTIRFVITTSAKKLRSNNHNLLDLLDAEKRTLPNNIILKEGLTKNEYYQELLCSHIQLNTADQDFVSYTLLEATTYGCRPLYPNYLSFPEALQNDHRFLYNKNDIEDAGNKILKYIYEPIPNVDFIYKPYNDSIARAIKKMRGDK